jgi:uncharacterized phage protein (TIGR01671 family)
MREIKFRAWDGSEMIFMDMKKDGIYPCGSHKSLMQYTGLKDKNSVEIYEGDILDSNPDEYPDDDPCPYIIIYHDGSYKGKRINGLIENALAISKSRLKVCNDVIIGNVHENPELLK